MTKNPDSTRTVERRTSEVALSIDSSFDKVFLVPDSESAVICSVPRMARIGKIRGYEQGIEGVIWSVDEVVDLACETLEVPRAARGRPHKRVS